MTGRRRTESEKRRGEQLEACLSNVSSEYVATCPSLFMSRPQVTTMMSRFEAYKLIQDVPGAVLETGVFRGNSLMWLAQVSQVLEPFALNRKFIGFDTFEGFRSLDANKDPKDVDVDTFADTRLGTLRQAIEIFDLDRPVSGIPKVELVVGDVSTTARDYANLHPELMVSMLILDTDLYQPTIAALEAFVPLMPPGGVILFDEVAYEFFPGETSALKEYFGAPLPKLSRFPFDSTAAFMIVN